MANPELPAGMNSSTTHVVPTYWYKSTSYGQSPSYQPGYIHQLLMWYLPIDIRARPMANPELPAGVHSSTTHVVPTYWYKSTSYG